MKTPGALEGETRSVDLSTLHLCQSRPELEAELATALQRLGIDGDHVVALHTGAAAMSVCCGRLAGRDWPDGPEALAATATWPALPIRYRDNELGQLRTRLPSSAAKEVARLLDHFGVALGNLVIGAEAQAAIHHYCASLQALEEGIVLFQESDRDAVLARLLSLLAAMVHAPAGALFVLQEAGDLDSGLELAQVYGMPEHMVGTIAGNGEEPWALACMRRPTSLCHRDDDATLGGLDPATVPAVVTTMLSVPLRYQGVDTGICVLFNPQISRTERSEVIERVTSFGRLGAAVLHRHHLESIHAHQRSIQRELQIAAAIQARLLPREAPAIDRMDFAWHSLSANNIGGDYLDLVTSDLGDLCAIIADASGHGINSALLMSSFRSTYRAESPWLEPDALCRHLNAEVVHEVGTTGMFITAAALRIDRRTLRMTISSAGHNPLLLYRAERDDIVAIDAHGPPLGFGHDSEFGAENHQLKVGDVLLLYTDGVTEATNSQADMYGEERLQEVLRRHGRDRSEQILQAVLADLAAFTGRNRYDDDVSVSVIRIVPR